MPTQSDSDFTHRTRPLDSATDRPTGAAITTTTSTSTVATPTYAGLVITHPHPYVALVTLDRPSALNVLSDALIQSLNECLNNLLSKPDIHAIVLTGSPRVFSAGADVRELRVLSPSNAIRSDFPSHWSSVLAARRRRCPVIAAVNGIAFGGGCELALMADLIYCSVGARFAMPEVKLGLVPGAGGSQRLARAIGKARAMEMVLTGCEVTGRVAAEWGIAARVFEAEEECVQAAVDTAGAVAGFSPLAVRAAREVVDFSQEVGLREGCENERSVFQGLLAGEDARIGIKAFMEKKEARWVSE